MAVQQFIKFTVADLTFGIGITQINQILKPQEVFKVPNTPPFIEGLINLRGKVVTVFNLRKRFGMPEKENDENTKILIINMNDLLLGFTVDNVTEIVRINDEDLVDTPPSLKSFDKRFLSGVGKMGEKLILILDLEKVLTPDEELQVQEIVEENTEKIIGGEEEKKEKKLNQKPEVKQEPEAKQEPEEKQKPEEKQEPEAKQEPEEKQESKEKQEPEEKQEPKAKQKSKVKQKEKKKSNKE